MVSAATDSVDIRHRIRTCILIILFLVSSLLAAGRCRGDDRHGYAGGGVTGALRALANAAKPASIVGRPDDGQ